MHGNFESATLIIQAELTSGQQLSMASEFRIDKTRLLKDLEAFTSLGRIEGKEGMYRMAFTSEEELSRRWLIDSAEKAGLACREDGARNIFVRLGSWDESAVATGSHIDSVPAGGHLDGALGVIAGFECLRRLKELNIDLRCPVELIAFTDEEGRYGSMLGSRAICGKHTRDELVEAVNVDGERLDTALARFDRSVDSVLSASRSSSDYKAFVELHIEQGPVLDKGNHQIGVVTDIVGLFRWRAVLIGEANHAGTTPMNVRKDAFAGLVEFASNIENILDTLGSEHSRATIGKVENIPGAMGVVPAETHFSMDVRDPCSSTLKSIQSALEEKLNMVAKKRGLDARVETVGELEPVKCDERLQFAIERASNNLQLESLKLPSGAAHDAQTMASLTDVAMIFIPSSQGLSHSPFEHSHDRDIENGTNVLLNTLAQLVSS